MKRWHVWALVATALAGGLGGCATDPRGDVMELSADSAVEREDPRKPWLEIPLRRFEYQAVVWEAGGVFRATPTGFWTLARPELRNNRVWENPARIDGTIAYYPTRDCSGLPLHSEPITVEQVPVRTTLRATTLSGRDLVLEAFSAQVRCGRFTVRIKPNA